MFLDFKDDLILIFFFKIYIDLGSKCHTTLPFLLSQYLVRIMCHVLDVLMFCLFMICTLNKYALCIPQKQCNTKMWKMFTVFFFIMKKYR